MLLTAALLLTTRATQGAQAKPIYLDRKAPLEKRVEDLFNRTTPEERMDLLTGTGFTTRPIARLGVPAMPMADAGQGVRGGMPSTEGPATAFPSGVAMASTWDPELIRRVGKAIGEEALNKGTGVQVLLGPAVNIHRSPLGGRNGEYFSEDPYLSSRLAVTYIQGMQSKGCAACVKHYAANNEEVDRGFVDVRVDERTLREIYLPSFEAAVREGKVWTVMSSYNKVNGFHASANHYLLTDVLKKGWGFDGMVMSDWGGVHETVGVVNAGNDLEMPGPGLLSQERVARALARGQITQAQIDDNAKRILRTVIRTGLLDGPKKPDHKMVDSPAHRKLTFEAASQGIVLLKNQGNVLPLDRTKVRSIAVIGSAAKAMQVGAAGSPTVTPFYTVQPLDGIRKAAGKATVRYAQGDISGQEVAPGVLADLKAEYFKGREISGEPVVSRAEKQIRIGNGSPAPGIGANDYSVRWTAKLTAPSSGTYRFSLAADDGCRLFVNDKPVIDQWHLGGETDYPGSIELEAGKTYDIRVEYFQAGGSAALKFSWLKPEAEPFADAIAAAKASDVAVVCVSTQGTEGEGQDRPSMELPRAQDELIEAVIRANPKTIVVLNNGTPVDMRRWVKSTPAILETWFPGQEGGAALAAVLFGDVNPSGKLPDTLAARREQYPDFGNFPGVRGTVKYPEGIYVGYRHFDKAKIVPTFPFGHGLSYTQFKYGVPTLSAAKPDGTRTATIAISNVGKRAGAEVVQLYVHDPKPKIDRPVRELKGFKKLMLQPGQTQVATFVIPPRALAYCDVKGRQWKADAGTYDLEFGSSSRDIRSRAKMVFAKEFKQPIPLMRDVQAEALVRGSDLARNRPATASSVEDRKDVGDLSPAMAVDGDDGTRWSSGRGDNQWLMVDLGSTKSVGRVELRWEEAYATAFSIQVSQDGENWKDVYTTEEGNGGAESLTFKTVVTRFVRVFARKRATEFGVSLFRFEVYPPAKKKA